MQVSAARVFTTFSPKNLSPPPPPPQLGGVPHSATPKNVQGFTPISIASVFRPRWSAISPEPGLWTPRLHPGIFLGHPPQHSPIPMFLGESHHDPGTRSGHPDVGNLVQLFPQTFSSGTP